MSGGSGRGGSGPETTGATLDHRANRMDLVSRWADDLAHEIKNPLHAMVINLELVKRRAASGDPEPVIQRAGVVENELHRVHDLVDSLLRLVRPWPDEDICDVDRIFEHLLPVLGARTRIRRVGYDHHPGGGVVALPPGDLAQVLLNLVDNAIEASPEGGSVVTRCEMGREAVSITVQDDGPGLPEGALGEAGAAGAEPAPGHAGLGLAVTADLLRRAGGDLAFRPGGGGRGTVAVVTVPRPASA